MVFQNTLKKYVMASGIGLHTGARVTIKLHPAPVDSGIRFVRTDLDPVALIPANIGYVTETSLATTVGNAAGSVSTIEHLMAAFFGMGIDNAIVEIDGPEVPIMDGSAYPFVAMIKQVGLSSQKAPRRYIEILEPVTVSSGDKTVTISPCDSLYVSVGIDFDHPMIARQQFDSRVTPHIFERRISRARTFGFLKEVEYLKENGLALGGCLDNALVLDDKTILNQDGLRFSDEFVRHKALDLIGDIYLLGNPVLGKIDSFKSGHAIHHLLSKELLNRPYTWRLVELDAERPADPWAVQAISGEKGIFTSVSV
ncbi:UDP-3-O-acyl-N-acetylglucosamine deacetylase [Dissulfurimicrobium hydrothermale]|uniref:UDP-3-O-acyl-N-acetylglucosamine deacetylase n=1 Tax=Dissulfurimicrobium hydrothermale TaxID=1750598 RepID=UPI001EDC0F30|nr:UDP-3-O-acyl-N-acetylglucosamine deacetylase [Dissulfurimicrobium hydrothermale]UKL13311.1 UDP-3-O-acyl-N-acetylglucosamine deacetylase [Dissulfurimicrobium hydrothermale]